MLHSDLRTTMSVYGSAYDESKRQASERVAGKLLAMVNAAFVAILGADQERNGDSSRASDFR